MPGGNPNHDPKNGEFTTGAGDSGAPHNEIGTKHVVATAPEDQWGKLRSIKSGDKLYTMDEYNKMGNLMNERDRLYAQGIGAAPFHDQISAKIAALGEYITPPKVSPRAVAQARVSAKDYVVSSRAGHNVIGTRHVGGKRHG